MATGKAADKNKKVMDVSKPSETKAGATSKPVIIGHKPLIGDPMVREDVPVSELSPTDHKEVAEQSTEKTESETSPKKITIEEHAEEAEAPEEEAKQEAQPKESGMLPDKEEEQAADSAQEVVIAKKAIKLKPSVEAEDKVGNAAAVNTVLGDAQGVKEAEVAELERQEAAEKLAASGQYRVKLSGSSRHHGSKLRSIPMLVLLLLLVAGVLAYLAVDSGFIKSDINLPFHVFKQDAPAAPTTSVVSQTPSSTNTTDSSTPVTATPTIKIPANFTAYKMVDAAVSFAYPTDWGNVLVTPEKGYSKRDSTLSSSGVYAYKATFSKNSDIELVVTSNKYLPAARGRFYYDYLQWCKSTTNGKTYNSILNYKTSGGVDTPDQVTCDQGPLNDAFKLDADTISQDKVKDALSLAVIGDVYTHNLTTTGDLVVLHIKDATSKNAVTIKQLLPTILVNGG